MRSITLACCFLAASLAHGAESAEPLFRDLPPGLVLKSSVSLPAEQTKAIAARLGGKIERLTNSVLQVHGRSIQVNVIAAGDDAGAKAIHAALGKIKPYPFCLRQEQMVIEYVGQEIDAALAFKTSYELGLLEKPDRVRYRVVAELAPIETADYMACNPLFNQFLALGKTKKPEVIQQIKQLSEKFTFGQSLSLRNPRLYDEPARHQFAPAAAATETDETAAAVRYNFEELPDRHGVPYVTATLEISVGSHGLLPVATAPGETLTAATSFWPADDAAVVALARKITSGQTTNSGKAEAILAWLSPGNNLKYSGQTGSRWGVAQALKQKFGHCWDFSDCFVTLCRAAGVPSRQVAGWLYGSSGHVWAEYYREDAGWQQVDPTGGGVLPCGIYHIPYFTSEAGEMPIVYLSLPTIEALR